jgi:hypothetical protein
MNLPSGQTLSSQPNVNELCQLFVKALTVKLKSCYNASAAGNHKIQNWAHINNQIYPISEECRATFLIFAGQGLVVLVFHYRDGSVL